MNIYSKHLPHRSCLLVLLWALAAPSLAHAADILDYLPEDALGFVLIRDLAGASAQCEHLTQMFAVDSPGPMTFFKFKTGLGDGIDFGGDFLAAMLPGARATDPPEPLAVLPIADYAKFAASVHGDESGEVCRITIAGEDVLVAQHGPYAMIMNVESRETLEIMIGLEPSPVKLVEPWNDWLRGNAVTLTILPPGVHKVLELGRQGLAQQRQQWGQEFGDPEFADILGQMQQSLSVYQTMLDLFGTKVHAAAIGASLSESKDLRFGLRMSMEGQPVESSETAPFASVPPLAGYPDGPFVFAGGGPTSAATLRGLASASVLLMKQSPETYGYENFDDQAWKDLEATYIDLTKHVHSATILMTPGEKGDPLFGNFHGVSTVDNAAEYLTTYKQAVETWNRLTAQSTSDIKMQYEVNDTKVAGADACEIVADVAAAARDPNVPMFNWMLESMFGEDGKLRILLVAADEKTLVGGLIGKERMVTAVDHVKQQEQGLQDSVDVQTTAKLLPAEATWKFYVSPRGCVTWFQRVLDELFQIVQQNTQLPEYAAGPPVGVSVHVHQSLTDADLVWPAQSLESLAEFVKKCKAL